MNQLIGNISELLHVLETEKDLEKARIYYKDKIEPLIQEQTSLPNPLTIALIEIKEMLFIHPTFSAGMQFRDIHTSIAIIRDELEGV